VWRWSDAVRTLMGRGNGGEGLSVGRKGRKKDRKTEFWNRKEKEA